jgi:shikimate kinase
VTARDPGLPDHRPPAQGQPGTAQAASGQAVQGQPAQGQPAHGQPAAIMIGPPGAGKTTVGTLVAGLLGLDFVDTDTVIEQAAGKPVSDIFVQDGEDAFRALERRAVAHLIGSHRGVLALGGGAILDPGTRELLAGRRVVYLETGFVSAVHRTGLDAPRPLLFGNPRARMKTLLEERLPVYAGLAWITVPTDDREPGDIAGEIAARLGPGSQNGHDQNGHDQNGHERNGHGQNGHGQNGHGPAAPPS